LQHPAAKPVPRVVGRATPSPPNGLPQVSAAATTIRSQLLSPKALPPQLQNIHAGLIHWWGLHELAGVRHDSVGLKDLADQGRVGSAMGVLGTCASFNGKQYLQVASDSSLQIRGSTTFAVWVRFSSMKTTSGVRDSHALLGKWSSGREHDYMICFNYLRETRHRFEFIVEETGPVKQRVLYSSFANATTDTWYFVVCQYDAQRGVIGISINDGAFDAMNVAPLRSSDNPLFVGADHGPPWNNLTGDLARLGMWNRLLSSAEITALYNNGRGVDLELAESQK
jgi:hypothetical protein